VSSEANIRRDTGSMWTVSKMCFRLRPLGCWC